MPGAPAFVAGIIQLRGRVVPVVDLLEGAPPEDAADDGGVEPLAGVDLALSIERKVVAVLRHQQMCECARRGASARGRHRRRWRLGDGIARGAGIFRPNVTNDLEVPRHIVQHLGHVLAELGHPKPRKLLFPEHHISHAASAFYPSPFEEAMLLAIGHAYETTTAWVPSSRPAGG